MWQVTFLFLGWLTKRSKPTFYEFDHQMIHVRFNDRFERLQAFKRLKPRGWHRHDLSHPVTMILEKLNIDINTATHLIDVHCN